MLTRPQIILLKRAQHDAGIGDAEYREVLQTIAGVSTSKDPKLTDEHLDKLLKYFEAIFWRKVDQANAEHAARRSEIFQRRGYWRNKNTRAENSRDRFTTVVLKQDIDSLERQLMALGCSRQYLNAINAKIGEHDGRAIALAKYRYALSRTLAWKQTSQQEKGEEVSRL